MNILIVLAVASGGFCLLWAVQSIALTLIGEPLAWPLRFTTKHPAMRWVARVMIHTFWLIILIGTPLALGASLPDAFRQAFPTPVPWRDIAVTFSLMFFPTCLIYVVYYAVGWLRIEPQRDAKTRRGKLFRRFFPGPIPLATFEEGVFRGVLLEQLLRSFPDTPAFTVLSVIVSSAVFASVHFVKPAKGKPVRQLAYGYFIVGCLFGLAYVVGGRSLWLPIVLHATAVFVIEVARLYVVFQAPRWLVGFPESPQSGVIGSLIILGVGIAMMMLI